MTDLTTQDLITETKGLVSFGRKIALKVAENVWRIREALYPAKEQHKEFVQFCESEFGIKSSAVSKYEGIGDGFYAHGLTAESFKIDGDYRDYEVVYAASKLPLGTEEKLAHALTLKRSDIQKTRQALAPHTPDYKRVCVVDGCWTPEETHP